MKSRSKVAASYSTQLSIFDTFDIEYELVEKSQEAPNFEVTSLSNSYTQGPSIVNTLTIQNSSKHLKIVRCEPVERDTFIEFMLLHTPSF